MSSHCQRNRETDREREKGQKIKNRKQRVGERERDRGRKKRTFFIPLLDELARYRVARRSNHSERGGEREKEREREREIKEENEKRASWAGVSGPLSRDGHRESPLQIDKLD